MCVFSACDTSKYVTVNTSSNTGNKSNTAVVTNANSTTTSTSASNPAANTTSSANTAASTDGQTLNMDEAGVAMTVPKGMNFSKEGQDTIVKTEDEGVDTRFRVLSEDNIDKS